MKFKDYYAVLGLARTATQDEIKRAYRKLARKFHPDVSKEDDADSRFKELGEAYAVLKDAEKREKYDRLGSQWKAGQEFQPSSGWGANADFSDQDIPDGFGNADGQHQHDFFEALFGRHRSPGHSRYGPEHGQDHHAKVMIDLIDAYRGTQRSIGLRVPVLNARGQVSMEDRTLEVKIPKGVRAGQHLRLGGQGGMTLGDGPAGDLYLEIGFNPDARFHVDGREVYLHLPLAPWEAMLGASVTVPTPEGPVQLSIPAGSQAGRHLRLKGRGIPGSATGNAASQAAGNLTAILSIALPPADSDQARAAYSTLAKAFDFNPRRHFDEHAKEAHACDPTPIV